MARQKKEQFQELQLNIFKARDVKTPEKYGNAAGWDFYIPNDLTIFDFTNNIEIYINEFIDFPAINKSYTIPLEFSVKINDENIIFMILVKTEEDKLTTKIIRKPGTMMVTFLNNFDLSEEELNILKTTKVENIKILPGSKILIPSGIHVNLPEGVFLVGENKSGISAKRGLIKAAQVIDQDYQGQIHINLINPTHYAVNIKPGEKIIQFVPYFQPVMKKVKEFKSKETLYAKTESARGEGGFGSSGIK